LSGIAVAHRESTTPDGVLVQEAAAGSGVSYGALYDRHAAKVFNYCLRVTGSPDDAADATQEAFLNVLRRLKDDDSPVLEFSSYLFAAARNESYALMRRRALVHPSESPPEERGRAADLDTQPETAMLLRDSQEAVRAANAKLTPRHREVLALREVGGQSYDEIGRVMGISENGAAQLIWRARSKLREAMTAGAVASVVASSPECERAQVLLSRLQDGEAVDQLDCDWLDDHLQECGSCRSAKGMLLEVGATYSAWMPIAAVAGMREETLVSAGNLIGADWSGSGAGSSGNSGGAGVAVVAAGALAVIGVALATLLGDGDKSAVERRVAEQMQPPAESAAAPADRAETRSAPGSEAPFGQTASRAGGAAPGSPLTGATRGEPRSSRPGEPGAGQPRDDRPRDNRAPRENSPGETGPTPRDRSPGPRDTTPAPRDTPPRDTSPTPRDGIPPPRDTSPTPPVGDPAPPPERKPDPPIVLPPPPPGPPEPAACRWPGEGKGGPADCPPGHGGTPPGRSGVPPGRGGG
jgi:RNA polymerase sigma-70 factor (ECF subfamily)